MPEKSSPSASARRAAGSVHKLTEILEFLRLRQIPGVEAVSDSAYRRTASIDGHVGVIRAGARLTYSPTLRSVAGEIRRRVRRLFDLDAPSARIAAHLARDPRLRPALRGWTRLVVPGCWDPFELAVRAILGQQITVRAASTMAGKLAARFGRPFPDGDDLTTFFPEPADLVNADLESIGLIRTRAAAIRTLAAAALDGSLRYEPAELTRIRGIGDWTAQYIAMRALKLPDAFPEGDLILQRALGLSQRELLKAAERWRPWRAYAVLPLWRLYASRE